MMKLVAFMALIVVASAMTDREAWTHFKAKHGKTYGSYKEEGLRYNVFAANLRKAEKVQAENPSAVYGITKFMDLTTEEFRAQFANLNSSAYGTWVSSLPKSAKPKAASPVDWRGKAVASVKDQEQCGSCWAFSAAAAMESCMMLKNGGTEVDVSAQQIVDCCTAGGSDGCNGGYPDQAIGWAVDQDLATWKAYPYKGEQTACKEKKPIAVPKGTCKFVSIPKTEAQVISHLQQGPVSIAIAADVLQYYNGGIISGSDCSDTSVDHAVFLTTYTGSAYAVKNSWGADWGEQGYFRMISGKNCLQVAYLPSQALPK